MSKGRPAIAYMNLIQPISRLFVCLCFLHHLFIGCICGKLGPHGQALNVLDHVRVTKCAGSRQDHQMCWITSGSPNVLDHVRITKCAGSRQDHQMCWITSGSPNVLDHVKSPNVATWASTCSTRRSVFSCWTTTSAQPEHN